MTTYNKVDRLKDLLLQRAELQVQINAELKAFDVCGTPFCGAMSNKCAKCVKHDAIWKMGKLELTKLNKVINQVRLTTNKPSLKRGGYTRRIDALRQASISEIKARYSDI
jgi:hypothetical protein